MKDTRTLGNVIHQEKCSNKSPEIDMWERKFDAGQNFQPGRLRVSLHVVHIEQRAPKLCLHPRVQGPQTPLRVSPRTVPETSQTSAMPYRPCCRSKHPNWSCLRPMDLRIKVSVGTLRVPKFNIF